MARNPRIFGRVSAPTFAVAGNIFGFYFHSFRRLVARASENGRRCQPHHSLPLAAGEWKQVDQTHHRHALHLMACWQTSPRAARWLSDNSTFCPPINLVSLRRVIIDEQLDYDIDSNCRRKIQIKHGNGVTFNGIWQCTTWPSAVYSEGLFTPKWGVRISNPQIKSLDCSDFLDFSDFFGLFGFFRFFRIF